MFIHSLPRSIWRVADIVLCGLVFMGSSLAQGGPPMITDDPDTPGDGHWEINLAAVSSRASGQYSVALPDADINYGLGEHLQLKADIPLVLARQSGQASYYDLGTANFGVKWRFVDEEDTEGSQHSSFNVSTYPQLQTRLNTRSVQQGTAAADRSFYLPLEASGHFAHEGPLATWIWVAEVGRSWLMNGPDASASNWQMGLLIAHDCAQALECLAEWHETWFSQGKLQLVNFGFRLALDENIKLIGSAGRQSAINAPTASASLMYLGTQLSY